MCHNHLVRALLLIVLGCSVFVSGCFLDRSGTRSTGRDAASGQDGGRGAVDAAACPGVDLATDPENCGACGARCLTVPTATATCSAGVCGLACNPGRGDCDGLASSGCEVDLNLDAAHCGACGDACAEVPLAANQEAGGCVAGSCQVRCAAGFGDCDGDPSNGCEADLGSERGNCGSCGRVCPLPPRGQPFCADGACAVRCDDPRFVDCNGIAADGCEEDVQTDLHCGLCSGASVSAERICVPAPGCVCDATECACSFGL